MLFQRICHQRVQPLQHSAALAAELAAHCRALRLRNWLYKWLGPESWLHNYLNGLTAK